MSVFKREKDKGKKEKTKSLGICVMVFPGHWSTIRLAVPDLAKILEPLSERLYVISGNIPRELFSEKVHFIDLKSVMHYSRSVFPRWIAMWFWTFKILIIQVKMSFYLLRISRNVDIVVFYLAYLYQLPLLTAKILRKKAVLLQTNTISEQSLASSSLTPLTRRLGSKIIKANCAIADYIVPESEMLAHEYSEFGHKVLPYGARFVDTNLFKIKTPIERRKNLVGYLGRLSPGKGIMNLIEAMPMIMGARDDIEFLINGDGPLLNEIKEKLRHHPQDRVSVTEWRPREEVPDCLNELKLIVLPSYSEGLPNVVLEAFACGTPVLATPVGAVTDLVKDGETGFIMEDNSPECIARNILRALEHSNLSEITRNAKNLIDQRYTYQATVERYRGILDRVSGHE